MMYNKILKLYIIVLYIYHFKFQNVNLKVCINEKILKHFIVFYFNAIFKILNLKHYHYDIC